MDDWLQFTSHCYTRIVTDVRLNVDIAVTMHAGNSVPKNIKALAKIHLTQLKKE